MLSGTGMILGVNLLLPLLLLAASPKTSAPSASIAITHAAVIGATARSPPRAQPEDQRCLRGDRDHSRGRHRRDRPFATSRNDSAALGHANRRDGPQRSD